MKPVPLVLGGSLIAVGAYLSARMFLGSGDIFEANREEVSEATQELMDPNVQASVSKTNGLGWELIRRIDSKEDVLVSPLGLTLALSLAHRGATGNTKTEIESLLGVKSGVDPLVAAVAARTIFEFASKGASTKVAGLVSSGPKVELKPSWVDAAESAGFEVGDESLDEWISKSTDGAIERSALGQVGVNGVSVANALKFRGAWDDPFSEGETAQGMFRTEDGEILPVNMMHTGLTTAYFEDADHTAITIPFDEQRFLMWIALPAKGTPVGRALPKAAAMFAGFAKGAKDAIVALSLPRFDTSSMVSLKEGLVALGTKRAFDSALAEFTEWSSAPQFHLTELVQQASMSVDEEGAVVVVVTELPAAAGGSSTPEEVKIVKFIVDRPFLFAIYDSQTNATLLQGVVRKPSPK